MLHNKPDRPLAPLSSLAIHLHSFPYIKLVGIEYAGVEGGGRVRGGGIGGGGFTSGSLVAV